VKFVRTAGRDRARLHLRGRPARHHRLAGAGRCWPQQTREIAAAYLASGLDPAKAIIFPQSAVREHAELAWIFQCVARLGWLDRMTQFKEKSGKHKERSLGGPLHLSRAAGGRHPDLQGDSTCRSARTRSSTWS
jgi:tryptophanyl-tRNA synthetase